MKKLLILSVLLAFSTILLASNPPEIVTKAFLQKFPKATEIKWSKENSNEWEASFKLENVTISANYSNTGEWIETETEIPVSKIPEQVIKSINQSYKGWQIQGGAIIEKAKSDTVYEVDIKSGISKKEVLYKSDGTLIK